MYYRKKKGGMCMGRQIDFNVTGKARGELAKAIGELLNKDVKYMKVPTCNYDIGGSILDRNGVFIPSDELSDSQVELLLERFVEKYTVRSDKRKQEKDVECIEISMPKDMFSELALENLKKLIAGKETILKHAFRTEQLDVIEDQEKISFPWFPLASEPDAVTAYTEFISKLCNLAINAKRVSLTDKEVVNEKYAFRCFLLRLGFIGDEYKIARKILLENLSGNSAFRV